MVLLKNQENGRSHVLMPVLLSACAIPVSMLLLTVNVLYSVFQPESRKHHNEDLVISPWRWLASVMIPLLFAFWGLRKKSLDLSGAILGNK